MTVGKNLAVGAGSGREGQRNLDTVVETIPMIKSLLKRNASTLSGAQQQAVAIGRSLMSNPEVQLLNEVSLGLAPIIIDELYYSLAVVQKRSLEIILVEQDLARSVTVADRIVCMLEGHNVLEGTPAHLSDEQITDVYLGHAIASFADGGPTDVRGD